MWKKSCLQGLHVKGQMGRCLLSVLLLFTIISGLFSCAPTPTAVPGENAVSFTDDLGREVTVKKNPQRVAALIGSFADVWMLAGGRICATADDAWEDFDLALDENTVNLGGTKNPSLEKLLSASPDFVIASASTAKNIEWLDILESAGITVAYFSVSCFKDYVHMLDICTDITGRKDLYRQNGEVLQTQIETIRAEMKDQVASTVLFLRASAGYIRAKNSSGSILGEMLADLGCENIADSDAHLLEELSMESILLRDPTHIFIVQVGDNTEEVMTNFAVIMEENPAWLALSAVKEGRVHWMEKRLFNLKPNARWAEAYEILKDILLSFS